MEDRRRVPPLLRRIIGIGWRIRQIPRAKIVSDREAVRRLLPGIVFFGPEELPVGISNGSCVQAASGHSSIAVVGGNVRLKARIGRAMQHLAVFGVGIKRGSAVTGLLVIDR